MQGLFRRAAASIVALCLLAPQIEGVSFASPHRAPQHTSVALASPPQRIPVKEPVRTKAPALVISALRPKTVQGLRAHGVHVDGPPMLRPNEIDRVMSAARRRAAAAAPTKMIAPPARAVPQPPPSGTRPGTRHALSLPSDPTASGTGINPWWRYQEQNVPGGGHVMVNVGTGNILLQDDDMSVPHKGIAMAFRRTYNSQMPATIQGYAMSWQSLYGTGWTNTFDAHMLDFADGSGGKSVYDVDGARYDYKNVGTTTPVYVSITPGQHATLVSDGVCGALWTKKSGTVYYFYGDNPAKTTCPGLTPLGGYAGRLYQIVGRNRNTYITFSYSWDNGDASVNGKISGITATTESGMAANLAFGDVNGHRLLQQITFPDGSTSVQYGYDTNGNLGTVSRPANNASGIRPLQSYGYQALGSDQMMVSAMSPRWNAGGQSSGGYGSDGGYLRFGYSGSGAVSSALTSLVHGAVVNPTISDGTNSGGIQPGFPTNSFEYLVEYYTTGTTAPTFRDTDGHMTNWIFDGVGRPTQTQECTASANQGQQCTGIWLVRNETWDPNNNLTAQTDARGNETDYAADSNGNTIAIGEPQTATSQGSFKPTTLISYDAFNNVVAICDPTATHSLGLDWSAAPNGDSTCPITDSRAKRLIWSVDPSQTGHATASPVYEPYGELLAVQLPGTTGAPSGYKVGYAYAGTSGVDYGDVTTTTGDPIPQSVGGQAPASFVPTQSYQYDANGNTLCRSNGLAIAAVLYDNLGRVTVEADGDDSSVAACGKPASSYTTAQYRAYYSDGSVKYRESSAQHAADVSSGTKAAALAYAYDLDGNVTSETRHIGCTDISNCTPGVTNSWYDGADRLVEVMLPHDPTYDYHKYKWLTRYLYDLTGSGNLSLSISASSQTTAGTTEAFRVYGNLYDTQEWVDLGWSSDDSAPRWVDHRGTAYDALDRPTASYDVAVSMQAQDRASYDATPTTLGLLQSQRRVTGESISNDFDAGERLASVSYALGGNAPANSAGASPNHTYTYDAAGRVATINSALGTETYTYDAVGRKLSDTEPAAEGGNTISYSYTPNGWRSSLSVSGSLNETLFQYGYRQDGRIVRELVNSNGWKSFDWTYTSAGRLLQRTDPTTGTTIHQYSGGGSTGSPFGPLTYSLNQFAQLSGVTYSDRYAISQITTDLDGYRSYENDTASSAAHVSAPHKFTIRGEDVGNTSYPFEIANGIRLSLQYAQASTGPAIGVIPASGAPTQFNSLDGYEQTTSGTYFPFNTSQNVDYTNGFTYDASGRLLGTDLQECSQDTNTLATAGQENATTNSYDAANHLLAQTVVVTPSQSGTCALGPATWGWYDNYATSWGTNGHPIEIVHTAHTPSQAQTAYSEFLHWDGNVLLFTSAGASGQPDNIKIGEIGEIRPSDGAIAVFDRNSADWIESAHTTSQGDPSNDIPVTSDPTSGPKGWSWGNISEPKGESLSGWMRLSLQGVRGVDANLGHWTTPDAAGGDLSNPTSLKPYAYENNNSYAYSDPTGFSPESDQCDQWCGTAGKAAPELPQIGGTRIRIWPFTFNSAVTFAGNNEGPPRVSLPNLAITYSTRANFNTENALECRPIMSGGRVTALGDGWALGLEGDTIISRGTKFPAIGIPTDGDHETVWHFLKPPGQFASGIDVTFRKKGPDGYYHPFAICSGQWPPGPK